LRISLPEGGRWRAEQIKKPRAKPARGFEIPPGRLAVFFVEQVALNRHAELKRAKIKSPALNRRRAFENPFAI